MSEKIKLVYKYLCVGIFFLIALGGSVRAMNAGLACPDWPLCFGEIIPDYHPEVYFEFIHRVLAGLIGIVSIYLNIKVFNTKSLDLNLRYLALFAIFLLLAQVVMGGLTVLLLLHSKVVALHLGMGTSFFALSLWIYLSLTKRARPKVNSGVKKVSLLALVAIFVQIILGGLVASNYAVSVCPEFPLCHGEFIPTLQGTIGLHVLHRLGAYTLTAILFFVFFYVRKNVQNHVIRKYANLLIGVLIFQILIGISNVLLAAPPIITVLHLAMGTLLLGIATRMYHEACYNEGNWQG